MSMSSGNSSRKKAASAIDEVEELLRSAQDDILLKLSINSHMARPGTSSSSSTSYFSQTSSGTIDLDLDRRFEALKSKSKPKLSTESIIETEGDNKNNLDKVVVDDIDESDKLFDRFAALKNSIPSYPSSAAVSSRVDVDKKITNREKYESDDAEDEVDKIINWAIDAARLDPSPPSDDDATDSEKDSDSENDSDDEDNRRVNTKKKKKK